VTPTTELAEQRKRSIRRPTNADASIMDAIMDTNIENAGALAQHPRTEVAAAPP